MKTALMQPLLNNTTFRAKNNLDFFQDMQKSLAFFFSLWDPAKNKLDLLNANKRAVQATEHMLKMNNK